MCEWMSQNTRTMPGRSKRTGLRVAGGVAAEIERPRLRERKHVVVERSQFGKVDGRAGRDREHVRHERLVALIHHRAAAPRSSRTRRAAPTRGRRPTAADRARRARAGVPRSATPGRRSIGGGRAAQLDAAADRAAARGRDDAAATRTQRHKATQGRQRPRTPERAQTLRAFVSRLCPLCPCHAVIRTRTPAAPRRDCARRCSAPPSRVLC